MIYVIVGPTASGKTDAAIKISEMKNAPIINGDAFQIYKDMDIGTNKIKKSDPLYDRHHLLDIVSPDKTFSVRDYQKVGRETLDKLLKDNKDVIIVGGTGLYIKALLYDYEFPDEEETYIDDFDKYSNHELHEMLKKLDPEEASKIHENNRKRVMRAISLIRNNNSSKTDLLSNQAHKPIYKDVRIMFISPNRDILYQRINERTKEILDNGLVEEVKYLLNKYNLSLTARQGIGYKETIEYLENKITYEECEALIAKRTRNYAKRQVTFFKHQFDNIETYNSAQELIEAI